MERLTRRICGGWGVTPGYELNTVRGMEAVVDRLAAYEDTGLEPEDIDALQKRERGLAEMLANVSCGCVVPYTRLAELAQAEKDGRLVALPPNDPLTLEELREMDGEPVWVVGVSKVNNFKGHWDICEWDGDEGVIFPYCGETPDMDLLGTSWFACRRKPERDTTEEADTCQKTSSLSG